MTSANDAYFEKFVLPYVKNTDFNSSEPVEKKLDESKCVWAQKLTRWLKLHEKEMEIVLVPMHKNCMIAVVSVAVSADSNAFDLVQSICLLSQDAFECCFKDLYLNKKICGTDSENSEGKTVFCQDSGSVVKFVECFLLCTPHRDTDSNAFDFYPFISVVERFPSISSAVEFVNKCKRAGENEMFAVNTKFQNMITCYCATLLLYEVNALKEVYKFDAAYNYSVSEGTNGEKEKISSVLIK